jgi:hypothetical protein
MRGLQHAPDRRRVSRLTVGFWLGGVLLGTGGCVLGVYMPYHDPTSVAISAIWWGIYLGCFGASVGALAALLSERAPAPAARGVGERT